MALRPVSPAGPDFPAGLTARQAPISRLARHGASPGWPGWPRFPKCPNRPRFPGWSGWLDCLVGLTARLLRNFTSRFDDDDAPPLLASSLLLLSSPPLVPTTAPHFSLPTPHSPDRCRHLLILLTPPCWRSPTPLIAGQIAITSTRAGSHFSGGAAYGLHDYHPHAGRSQILTFHPFPIKPHEKIIGRGRFWVYLWDHM